MKKELGYYLENHDPLLVVPEGDKILQRIIAEGFIYSQGLFFFDWGWNSVLSGTGGDHLVKGKIKGPFGEDGILSWEIGNTVIRKLKDTDEYYSLGLANKKESTSKERNRARMIADEIMERRYGKSKQ